MIHTGVSNLLGSLLTSLGSWYHNAPPVNPTKKASTLHGIEAFLFCIQPHMLIVRAPRQSPGVVFLIVITAMLVTMAAVALAILMLD